MIAEHLPPEYCNQAELHLFVWKFSPDSRERQSGLLADLQEARAIKILLIKRENNHA